MKRLAWWINAAMLLTCAAIMVAAAVLWVSPRRVLLYPSANTETHFAEFLHMNGITLYHTTNPGLLRYSPGGVIFPMTSEKGRGNSVLFWGGMYRQETYRVSMQGTDRVLAIRFWLIIVLAGVYPSFWALLRWRWARRGSRHDLHAMPCPACGYDLRGTPLQCPECGAVPAGHGDSVQHATQRATGSE